MKVCGDFRYHVAYQLANSRKISFWNDDWCGQMPLRDRFPELFALATFQDALVADSWSPSPDGGIWAPLFRRGLKTGRWKLLSNSSGHCKKSNLLSMVMTSGGGRGKTKENL